MSEFTKNGYIIRKLENSIVYEKGTGEKAIGIVGLVHGDEICSVKAITELMRETEPLGRVKYIFANVEAYFQNKRFVCKNLNRAFPGNICGSIEERTAYGLLEELKDCTYVIDIHSTSYETHPFALSTIDSWNFDKLASYTGLDKYVIMTNKMASGSSLIDMVNNMGGIGISFEAGTHLSQTSVKTAKEVVSNFLMNVGAIKGTPKKNAPDKYYGIDVIKSPSIDFKPFDLINFALLKANTPYGATDSKIFSLDYDCYPFLYSNLLIDGNVFLVAQKEKPIGNIPINIPKVI